MEKINIFSEEEVKQLYGKKVIFPEKYEIGNPATVNINGHEFVVDMTDEDIENIYFSGIVAESGFISERKENRFNRRVTF